MNKGKISVINFALISSLVLGGMTLTTGCDKNQVIDITQTSEIKASSVETTEVLETTTAKSSGKKLTAERIEKIKNSYEGYLNTQFEAINDSIGFRASDYDSKEHVDMNKINSFIFLMNYEDLDEEEINKLIESNFISSDFNKEFDTAFEFIEEIGSVNGMYGYYFSLGNSYIDTYDLISLNFASPNKDFKTKVKKIDDNFFKAMKNPISSKDEYLKNGVISIYNIDSESIMVDYAIRYFDDCVRTYSAIGYYTDEEMTQMRNMMDYDKQQFDEYVNNLEDKKVLVKE